MLSEKARRYAARMLRSDDVILPPTRAVWIELAAVGLWVQEERPLHEPAMAYPLNQEHFRRRAKELGIGAEFSTDHEPETEHRSE